MKTGRVVVVTGAAGGMGRLFVERFLGNGDTVIASDTGEDALAALARDLRNEKLLTRVADVSDEASTRALADVAREKAGRVDVLVNVAGWFPIQPFGALTADEFRRVIDINLTGTFLMIKATAPLMQGRSWGRIINIGSASAFIGVASQAHYVAAKAGLFGLTRSAARALGGDGITVNVVTPGLTVTAAVKEHFPRELLEAAIEARAIKREERPADLVGAVFFLASPDADFITGQTLNVDGGAHMT